MRLLFLGTPHFAVPSLDKLAASTHQIVGVVTRQDRPAGRGMKSSSSPVKERALALGLPLFQFEKVSDAASLEKLGGLGAELNVVVAYGEILSRAALDLGKHGSINLHPSVLPAYRGAAPVQHALLNGDEITGLSVIKMDEGMDSGPIILQEEARVLPEDDWGTLCERLSVRGAELVLQAVELIAAGKAEPTPQQGEVTMARRLKPEDAALDLSRPSREVVNRVRACAPRPGAWLEFEGKRLKVLKAVAAEGEARGDVGSVMRVLDHGVLVCCGEGAVVICEVMPEGKKLMSARDYFCGRNIKPGSIIK